jgi:tetratricopeptide (TPR) repeat protein
MNQQAYIIALQEQINQGSYQKALDIAEQAICSFPFAAHFFFSASQMYTQLGDQNKALAAANHAILIAPAKPEYRIHRALLFLTMCNARSALADILIALEDQPQNLFAQTLLRMCELIASHKTRIVE